MNLKMKNKRKAWLKDICRLYIKIKLCRMPNLQYVLNKVLALLMMDAWSTTHRSL